MSGLPEKVVAHLRRVVANPQFESERYELGEEIGRGGMGTVYAAFDRELGRDVAIKISHGVAASSVEERLRREARVLARLEHPGIVPVHDIGRLADGRLFYVMKRVRGQTLRGALPSLTSMSTRLGLFERLCEAVAFAHASGVLHRDLKPDNVMLGAFGEVLVMDWGVAKLLDAPADLTTPAVDTQGAGTHAGAVLGTPGFMAPEQAAGATNIDARADVFGLGAILYILLTGEAPDLQADASGEVLRRRGVPRPLRAVCARALAPSPAARYASVPALSDDIARFRSGRAVTAHPESALDRIQRVARTYRVAILLILAYVIMRVAVAVLAGW